MAATRPELIQAMCRPLNISMHINTSFIYPVVMSKVLFLVEQNAMKHRQIVDPKPNKQFYFYLPFETLFQPISNRLLEMEIMKIKIGQTTE